MSAAKRDPSESLMKVCECLGNGELHAASRILRSECPFERPTNLGRRYSAYQCMRVFLRDAFIDRYSGQRLVNPAVLRLVSSLFPEEFPFHPNWKQSECHLAVWQLFPTIDHLVPVARGGADEESNWITTSMFRNSAKGNALLSEIEWRLQPPGDPKAWDGLTTWAIGYLLTNSEGLPMSEHRAYIQTWLNAAQRALADVRL
jgi:hypothetical protein